MRVITSRNVNSNALLCKVLQESKVLEELDLYGNSITLADGTLTDAIAKNKTLRILNQSSPTYLHWHRGAKKVGCSTEGDEHTGRVMLECRPIRSSILRPHPQGRGKVVG